MESPLKKFLTPDFFRELDDDYYQANPELWEEGPLYIDHQWAIDIYQDKTDRYFRHKAKDEKITSEYVKRVKRNIWEINRIYHVRIDGQSYLELTEQEKIDHIVSETWEVGTKGAKVIGQLKLIRIEPVKERRFLKSEITGAWLIFEKAG